MEQADGREMVGMPLRCACSLIGQLDENEETSSYTFRGCAETLCITINHSSFFLAPQVGADITYSILSCLTIRLPWWVMLRNIAHCLTHSGTEGRINNTFHYINQQRTHNTRRFLQAMVLGRSVPIVLLLLACLPTVRNEWDVRKVSKFIASLQERSIPFNRAAIYALFEERADELNLTAQTFIDTCTGYF